MFLKKIPFIFLFMVLFCTESLFCEDFPSIELKPLKDSENFSLNSIDSKYLLINFWASWCTACKYELKELNKFQGDFKEKGLKIITINLDEKKEKGIKFYSKNKLGLPVYQPSDKIEKYLKIKLLPKNYLINNKREIIKEWEGYNNSFIEELKSIIQGN